MTLLYDRALLLAKIETVFRTDANPVPATDALLVADPQYTPDITQLERDVATPDLSPEAMITGRKISRMTFRHEVRNNGNDDGTLSPMLGVLLQACGMSETQITGAAGTNQAPVADAGNSGAITWDPAIAAYVGFHKRTYTIECTTGGGTGVAVVKIDAPAIGEYPVVALTGITVTDGVAIDLSHSAQIEPTTITTPLVVGDKWTVDVIPAGYEYKPVSENMDSATLYLYLDGLLHKMPGARGTWSMDAPGGEFASFTFTFTGDYVEATDTAIPGGVVYETTLPQQVELSNLSVDGDASLVAAAYSMDIANEVAIRPDVNSSDSYAGSVITKRKPVGSFDPEATLEATHPFWANLSAATGVVFTAKIGTVKGNVVAFDAPKCQYSDLAYGNRNNIRTYDVGLAFARVSGNDEIALSFR